MFTRLSGKTALITGASAGIGRATAFEFASSNNEMKLVLTGRRADRLAEVKRELLALHSGISVHTIEMDVRDRAKVFESIDALPEAFKNISILVNNAGLVQGMDTIETVPVSAYDTMFDTNVKGLLNVTQAVLPGMKERNEGYVINVSSIAGTQVYPGGGIYCASKHAVDAITRTLRLELVSTKINVTSIDPGMVETEFSVVRFYGDKDKADAVYKGIQPLEGKDIAELIVFTASRRPHVNIANVLVLPTNQAAVHMVHRDMVITSTTPLLGHSEREDSENEIETDTDTHTQHDSSTNNESESRGSSAGFMQYLLPRMRYYVPVTGWLPVYKRECIVDDAVAGLSVACLLIPQALSYAQAIVRIAPVHGLYTCFAPLVCYTMLGMSRSLAVGPEALISILVGAAVRERSTSFNASGTDSDAADTAAMLAMMVGFFTFALGFFRLGFIDSVLSRALLRGFVSAAACVIVIDQTPVLLAIDPNSPSNNSTFTFNLLASGEEEEKSPIETLIHILQNLSATHAPTAIISILSIAILVIFRHVKSRKSASPLLRLTPEILILVVSSTLLSAIFKWDETLGVAVLKDVQGGFRAPQWPATMTLAKLRYYVLSAILISVIGFVESIVIAKTYATKHNYSVSPNRELVALGVANIVGSLFGGWPAFGSLGRSAVNDAAGAKTQLAGLVTGGVVLVTMLYLLPLFYYLPKAVCSSIIVVAAMKLIEWHDIEFILRVRAWNDLGLLLLTFGTTMFVSIEVGTLISVGTSLLLVVKHTTKTRIAVLGQAAVVDPATGQIKQKFRPTNTSDSSSPVHRIDGCLILRIEEGLFFGNTGQLKERLKRVEVHGEMHVHPGEAPRVRERSAARNDGVAVKVASADGRRDRTRSRSRSPAGFPISSQSSSTGGGDLGTEETHATPLVRQDVQDDLRCVIFDVGAMTAIDASATQTLLEIVEAYRARGITTCFVKLRESCKPWFTRSGLYSLVGSQHFFEKISDAIEFAKKPEQLVIEVHPSSPVQRINLAHRQTHQLVEDEVSMGRGLVEEEDEAVYVHPGRRPQMHESETGTTSWAHGHPSGVVETIQVRESIAERLARPSFVTGLGEGFHGGFVTHDPANGSSSSTNRDSNAAAITHTSAPVPIAASPRLGGRVRPIMKPAENSSSTFRPSSFQDEVMGQAGDSEGED
ncbi:Solute carrier 26 [Chytriomyces hyalinus]|nr:Solute carrier 26 [Chytriomyces hyalinus]